ncbi:MAG TPA: hypothetical protein VE993_01520 [Stellaceae bacterium]|nr:hypothetical protein [Stellaceae bacterium]
MSTRPDKPKEYFVKLLEMREEEIDYSEIPPTTPDDWKDAEVLLPVTREEFRTIIQLVYVKRQAESSSIFEKSENFSEHPLRSKPSDTTFARHDSGSVRDLAMVIEPVRYRDLRSELDELLHQVREAGYAEIRLRKLFRFLGKGSRAKGTWHELLEEWQGLGYPAAELFIKELPGERILLIWGKPDPIQDWAK